VSASRRPRGVAQETPELPDGTFFEHGARLVEQMAIVRICTASGGRSASSAELALTEAPSRRPKAFIGITRL